MITLQKKMESWGINTINSYLQNNTYLLAKIQYKNINRTSMQLSFLIGFFVTLLIVIVEIMIKLQGMALLSPTALFLLIITNIILVPMEFWLLFHIGFQTTARYIEETQKSQVLDEETKHALVRAILELPETKIQHKNYYTHSMSWSMILLYKSKVLLSNFLAKILLRKILSRSGARSFAPLIATLITGFWDAWVQVISLKEVRFRLSARLYTLALIKYLTEQKIDVASIDVIMRVVKIRMSIFGSYNTSLEYLNDELEKTFSEVNAEQHFPFDEVTMQQELTALPVNEQNKVRDIAHSLLAFNSKLNPPEKSFCNLLQLDFNEIKKRQKSFNELAN